MRHFNVEREFLLHLNYLEKLKIAKNFRNIEKKTEVKV